MNNNRKSKPSKFYVDFVAGANINERGIDVPPEPVTVEPHLLTGEIVIASANSVLKFAPLKKNRTGICGTLFVTNFKVSFVTELPIDNKERELHERSLQSQFLGIHDVCLSEIDSLYYYSEDNSKKKRLYSNNLPLRLSGLQLILKNLRIINFSFRFTPVGEGIKISKALLHHAFPSSIDHLFLSCITPAPNTSIPDYCTASDWEKELARTRCPNWRVSKHNEFFNLCSSLPTVLVVPRDLFDAQLEAASQHFIGSRPPVWCWGVVAGAALVRMAQISPTITVKQQENRMMGLVHKCHPKKLQPTILDLDQILPSLKDIQVSYLKLRELHTPDDSTQFWEQDRRYLSRWESSQWLTHVSKCLDVAHNAASQIYMHNSSVILQDSEGRDLSALISSLIQIMLEPHTRTIRGFHSLIQKEWVALGHPFTTRLGHTKQNTQDQCPVWLLFLDCVYQISEQHHTILEFTSQYLVALWHASHCSLHSSFTFNSINSKFTATAVLQRESPQQPIFLRPVWSWWAEGHLGPESQQQRSRQNNHSPSAPPNASLNSSAPSNSPLNSSAPNSTPSSTLSQNSTAVLHTHSSPNSTGLATSNAPLYKPFNALPNAAPNSTAVSGNSSSPNAPHNSTTNSPNAPHNSTTNSPNAPHNSTTNSANSTPNAPHNSTTPNASSNLTPNAPHNATTNSANSMPNAPHNSTPNFANSTPHNSTTPNAPSTLPNAPSSARQAFLNVYYIQSLLESLAIGGALKRIQDPLSSAFRTWRRLDHLLAGPGTLPYDPTVPLGPVQLDAMLRVESKISALKPWTDLFCAWMTEPVSLALNDSEALLKRKSNSEHHWKYIYTMFNNLKKHLGNIEFNGSIQN